MASSRKNLKMFEIAFIIMLVFYESLARPGGEWRENNACDNSDSTKREMCQRCAKQTKSPLVYPMCCNEEDEVHNWCDRYTNYGKVA